MRECSYEEYATHQERRDHTVDKYIFYIHCLDIKEFRYTNSSNEGKVKFFKINAAQICLAHQV
jgi:hypothetical protein